MNLEDFVLYEKILEKRIKEGFATQSLIIPYSQAASSSVCGDFSRGTHSTAREE